MTFSEEFISVEDSQGQESASPYPTAFGITFTPAISGAIIAVLGLAGAAYLILNQVLPTWQKYQELQASSGEKQAQVQQKQSIIAQGGKAKDELAQAQRQKIEVLGLFANEKTLDTLMLDFNQLVEASNAKLRPSDFKANLKKFEPDDKSSDLVTDGSLGPEVNNKLKRRVVKVEFQGTFEQTQSVIRNMERLQPLIILKEYESKLDDEDAKRKESSLMSPTTITTSFQLQAIIPATQEEVAKVTAPDKKEKK